jgi:hypothetical protein
MNQFKVGDKVKVVEITLAYAGNLRVDDTAIIKKFQINQNRFVMLVGDDSNECCWHDVNNIELVKPKWSIYNNTLPWSELSDKQKGELLLAAHAKIRFTCNKVYVSWDVAFNNEDGIYNAQYIEPVKSEPTMEELFLIDWQDCLCVGGKQEQKMIAKGWTKTCK